MKRIRVALLAAIVLVVAAVVGWSFWAHRATPNPRTDPEITQLLIGKSETEVVAILGQPDNKNDIVPGSYIPGQPDFTSWTYLLPFTHSDKSIILHVKDGHVIKVVLRKF